METTTIRLRRIESELKEMVEWIEADIEASATRQANDNRSRLRSVKNAIAAIRNASR